MESQSDGQDVENSQAKLTCDNLSARFLLGGRKTRPPWSPEEDLILLRHVAKLGTKNWSYLQASGLLPLRDQKACCNRFILLKRRGSKDGVLLPEFPEALGSGDEAAPALSVTSNFLFRDDLDPPPKLLKPEDKRVSPSILQVLISDAKARAICYRPFPYYPNRLPPKSLDKYHNLSLLTHQYSNFGFPDAAKSGSTTRRDLLAPDDAQPGSLGSIPSSQSVPIPSSTPFSSYVSSAPSISGRVEGTDILDHAKVYATEAQSNVSERKRSRFGSQQNNILPSSFNSKEVEPSQAPLHPANIQPSRSGLGSQLQSPSKLCKTKNRSLSHWNASCSFDDAEHPPLSLAVSVSQHQGVVWQDHPKEHYEHEFATCGGRGGSQQESFPFCSSGTFASAAHHPATVAAQVESLCNRQEVEKVGMPKWNPLDERALETFEGCRDPALAQLLTAHGPATARRNNGTNQKDAPQSAVKSQTLSISKQDELFFMSKQEALTKKNPPPFAAGYAKSQPDSYNEKGDPPKTPTTAARSLERATKPSLLNPLDVLLNDSFDASSCGLNSGQEPLGSDWSQFDTFVDEQPTAFPEMMDAMRFLPAW